jgi:hypothetical protein
MRSNSVAVRAILAATVGLSSCHSVGEKPVAKSTCLPARVLSQTIEVESLRKRQFSVSAEVLPWKECAVGRRSNWETTDYWGTRGQAPPIDYIGDVILKVDGEQWPVPASAFAGLSGADSISVSHRFIENDPERHGDFFTITVTGGDGPKWVATYELRNGLLFKRRVGFQDPLASGIFEETTYSHTVTDIMPRP